MSIIYPAGKALTYLPILFLLDGPRKKVMCDVSDRPVGIGTRLNQTELEEDYARFQPIRASRLPRVPRAALRVIGEWPWRR